MNILGQGSYYEIQITTGTDKISVEFSAKILMQNFSKLNIYLFKLSQYFANFANECFVDGSHDCPCWNIDSGRIHNKFPLPKENNLKWKI